MSESGPECMACGHRQTLREGAERCACSLCGALHVVDRTGALPSIRLVDEKQVLAALTKAQEDFKLVNADIRFLEGEVVAHRRMTVFSILAIALVCLSGAAMLVGVNRVFGGADAHPEPSQGTFLMPTMSKEAQNRVATQTIGGALLVIGLIVAAALPWRRWREPARALRHSRSNREVIEEVRRRLTERAQPQPR